MSDPSEYRDRPISAAAGAEYFGDTGLGDPYAAGFPYPVLLAMMRAFPDELGADWAGFRARFGALARSGTSDDGTVLPVGFHLTTDPFTRVAFVMQNCELCHAERLHLPQGDAFVPGLGNKRIRIHAYDAALARVARDPSFTVERLLPLADEAARQRELAWPPEWRAALVEATVRNLQTRQGVRAHGVEHLRGGLPGRVATIESFAMALEAQSGRPIPLPATPGWAKIPDVRNMRYRDTLSWDGVGTGAPTALVVEADLAVGARAEWFDGHRHIGTSLYMFLRGFERRLPFPGRIDASLAHRGRDLFERRCSRCHGRYDQGGAVSYREEVVSVDEVGTDPAREQAVTPAFVEAANAVTLARGVTRVAATGGYVPPPLVDVWMRAPFGHAGQWPSLRVMAMTPAERPRRFVVEPDAAYDLDAVGVRTRSPEPGSPSTPDYIYDGGAPGLGVEGHPFLADLGPDAAAVIEYLKTL
jgi:mono/diheme cytochrome c family protein